MLPDINIDLAIAPDTDYEDAIKSLFETSNELRGLRDVGAEDAFKSAFCWALDYWEDEALEKPTIFLNKVEECDLEDLNFALELTVFVKNDWYPDGMYYTYDLRFWKWEENEEWTLNFESEKG